MALNASPMSLQPARPRQDCPKIAQIPSHSRPIRRLLLKLLNPLEPVIRIEHPLTTPYTLLQSDNWLLFFSRHDIVFPVFNPEV